MPEHLNEKESTSLQEKQVHYGVWPVWEPLFCFILAAFLSAIPALFTDTAQSVIGVIVVSYILQVACYFLLPVFIVTVLRSYKPSALGLISTKWSHCLPVAIVCGLAFYLINVALATAISAIFPQSLENPQAILLLFDYARNNVELVMLIVIIVFLAPASEEMLFRAYLLPPLLNNFGRWPAYIISAILFAAAHQNVWVFVPIFAGGVGFAWLYDRYHNIFYNIIAHTTWNIIALSLYSIFAV